MADSKKLVILFLVLSAALGWVAMGGCPRCTLLAECNILYTKRL